MISFSPVHILQNFKLQLSPYSTLILELDYTLLNAVPILGMCTTYSNTCRKYGDFCLLSTVDPYQFDITSKSQSKCYFIR